MQQFQYFSGHGILRDVLEFKEDQIKREAAEEN